jgi:hypothetical protein
MKSPVAKRSIVVWRSQDERQLGRSVLERHQGDRGCRSITMSDLVSEIDRKRDQGNLSSAIRLQVLAHYRNQIPPTNLPAHLVNELRR